MALTAILCWLRPWSPNSTPSYLLWSFLLFPCPQGGKMNTPCSFPKWTFLYVFSLLQICHVFANMFTFANVSTLFQRNLSLALLWFHFRFPSLSSPSLPQASIFFPTWQSGWYCNDPSKIALWSIYYLLSPNLMTSLCSLSAPGF